MFQKYGFIQSLVLLILAASVAGCAKKGTGTTVTSQAYNSSVASLHFLDWLVPSAVATTSTITDVKLCVREFKLEGPEGTEVGDVILSRSSSGEGEGEFEIERKIGLVDLGDGTRSVDWGAVPLPAGTLVKKIKIEIHHDSELCGVAYSASVNGQSITKDIELKFVFSTPKTIEKTDSVTIMLSQLVAKLTLAAQAGHLDDSHIESYLDGSFEDEIH